MAVDSFMLFATKDDNKEFVPSESQVNFGNNKGDSIGQIFIDNPRSCFEVDEFSFDVEQVVNMSSQAGGGGAGKIQFNPFKVTRKIDKATSDLFTRACRGTHFPFVYLGFRKASGNTATGSFYLRFDFKMVILKTISWSHGEDSPTEDLELEYGALRVAYATQDSMGVVGGLHRGAWNKIYNVEEDDDTFKNAIKFQGAQ